MSQKRIAKISISVLQDDVADAAPVVEAPVEELQLRRARFGRRDAAQDALPKIAWRTRYAFRMSPGRRRPETSAKIFSASSLGTADGLSARTSVSSRSGISSATDTRYRLSMEIDFSPRSTSPMNLPDRPARSPSRSWLSARCLRSARNRCPRNFRTCFTARSPMVRFASEAEPEPDAMGRSAADSTATYDACQCTAQVGGVIAQGRQLLVPPAPPEAS